MPYISVKAILLVYFPLVHLPFFSLFLIILLIFLMTCPWVCVMEGWIWDIWEIWNLGHIKNWNPFLGIFTISICHSHVFFFSRQLLLLFFLLTEAKSFPPYSFRPLSFIQIVTRSYKPWADTNPSPWNDSLSFTLTKHLLTWVAWLPRDLFGTIKHLAYSAILPPHWQTAHVSVGSNSCC